MIRSLTQLLISFGILAAMLGAYAFWYYQVGQETARSAELEAAIRATVEGAVASAQTSDTLAALAADETAIQGYAIELADIVAFLERVEGTGRALGSSVEVVTVADKPSADNRIALTVRVIGSFDAVLRALGAIEYGPYDSRVTNLTFDTPATGNAWTAIVSLSVGVDPEPKP